MWIAVLLIGMATGSPAAVGMLGFDEPRDTPFDEFGTRSNSNRIGIELRHARAASGVAVGNIVNATSERRSCGRMSAPGDCNNNGGDSYSACGDDGRPNEPDGTRCMGHGSAPGTKTNSNRLTLNERKQFPSFSHYRFRSRVTD
jgi:hypothetical protein